MLNEHGNVDGDMSTTLTPSGAGGVTFFQSFSSKQNFPSLAPLPLGDSGHVEAV